jgi:Homeodomain-like domain
MNGLAQRQSLLDLVGQACKDGARLHRACAVMGLAARTVQRWLSQGQASAGQNALHCGDRRTPDKRIHNCPPNKLSDTERQAAMEVLNSDEYKDLPPSQIVPRLADQGVYVASESTLYRLLHDAGQMAHRRVERPPQKRSKPRALVATQVRHSHPAWQASKAQEVLRRQALGRIRVLLSRILCSGTSQARCSSLFDIIGLDCGPCLSSSLLPAAAAMRNWWSPSATRPVNHASEPFAPWVGLKPAVMSIS